MYVVCEFIQSQCSNVWQFLFFFFRENHEQDKPALNSLSENTVAMEVT